jgi:hypothetical protein
MNYYNLISVRLGDYQLISIFLKCSNDATGNTVYRPQRLAGASLYLMLTVSSRISRGNAENEVSSLPRFQSRHRNVASQHQMVKTPASISQ